MRKENCKKLKAPKLVTCILLIILCPSMFSWMVQASFGTNGSSSSAHWTIDLFTRCNSNSGKGSNQSSGATAPFEEVELHANTTYRGTPQANVFVSFQVIGPSNSSHPFMLFRSATTDKKGIATISFRIPLNDNPEESVIGVWQAFSTAKTPEPIEDFLTFEVKWPIEITSIRFLNEKGNQQSRFARGETSTVQLTLRNDALCAKDINLTLVAKDSAQTQIEQTEIQNIRLDSNSETIIEHEFEIPVWTAFGEGTIETMVYSGIYNDVKIQAGEPKIAKFSAITRAVAVSEANLSLIELYAGEPLSISLKVENLGDEMEELRININYDGALIGQLTATLAALDSRAMTYVWNTSGISEGEYTITAEVERVPWETELEDNKITAGIIRVNYPSIFPYAVHLFILLLIITGILTFSLLLVLWNRRQYTNQCQKAAYDFSLTQKEPKRTCMENKLNEPKKDTRRKSSSRIQKKSGKSRM